MKADTWMAFYVGDYLSDTLTLTTRQHGAYLLLILACWKGGGFVPSDDETLAAITKLGVKEWLHDKPKLAPYFDCGDGTWQHKRVERELAEALRHSRRKSDAGRAGADQKWGRSPADHVATRSARLATARTQATHTAEEWAALVEVCEGKCVRCGSTDKLVKDHILPIYQGGSDGIVNLQPLCHSCNSSKGPDASDLRRSDWLKCLAERLPDGWQMPAPSPSPSPSQVTTSLPASRGEQVDYLEIPAALRRVQTAHALPEDWKPLAEDLAWLKTARPDLTPAMIAAETERFQNHAKANNRTAHNWGPNWRNWMGKSQPPRETKPTPETAAATVVDRDSESQWRTRLRGFKPGVAWWKDTEWGPEPGQPGCRVPAPILAEWQAAHGD